MLWRVLGNVSLAGLCAALAVTHVRVARATGQWATALPIVVQEVLLVGLFLTRRASLATSTRPADWAAGITGTVLPLLLRPAVPVSAFVIVGQPLQIVALVLTVGVTLVLGRRIGIVAADRGTTTAGPYQIVRHPMYGSYLLAYLGYLLSYPTLANVTIVVLTTVAFWARAESEERLLARDPAYRDYLRRVRWRFVPWVY